MTGGKQSCDLCTRKKMYVWLYVVCVHVCMYVCMYRLYNEVEVSTVYTLPSACEVVYTVVTETELYNRLVPWGIATRVRSSRV